MNQDIYETILRHAIRRDHDWQTIAAMIQTSREFRQLFLSLLQRTPSWDTLFIQRGKVNLDRLAVACTFPELRPKAIRYVTGKSKFIYQHTIYQLNHANPARINALDITSNHGHFHNRWTSIDHVTSRVWGCTLKHFPGDLIPPDIPTLTKGFHFLAKLKPLPPTLLQELNHHFKAMEVYQHSADTNQFMWSTKHTIARRVEYATLLNNAYVSPIIDMTDLSTIHKVYKVPLLAKNLTSACDAEEP